MTNWSKVCKTAEIPIVLSIRNIPILSFAGEHRSLPLVRHEKPWDQAFKTLMPRSMEGWESERPAHWGSKEFLGEKGIGAPLTHTFTNNSRPLRQNHYTSSTTALHISRVGISQGMGQSSTSIDQHCNRFSRPQQFMATTTFKLRVRGPKTAKAER